MTRATAFLITMCALAISCSGRKEEWSVERTVEAAKRITGPPYEELFDPNSTFRRNANRQALERFFEILDRKKGDDSWRHAMYAIGQIGDAKDAARLVQWYLSVRAREDFDAESGRTFFTQISLMNDRGVKGTHETMKQFLTPSFWRKQGVSGRRAGSPLDREHEIIHDALIGFAWSRRDGYADMAEAVLQEVDDPEQRKHMAWLIKGCIEYNKNILKTYPKAQDDAQR